MARRSREGVMKYVNVCTHITPHKLEKTKRRQHTIQELCYGNGVRKSKKSRYQKRAQRVVEPWQCRCAGPNTSERRICRHELRTLWLDRRQLSRSRLVDDWAREQLSEACPALLKVI